MPSNAGFCWRHGVGGARDCSAEGNARKRDYCFKGQAGALRNSSRKLSVCPLFVVSASVCVAILSLYFLLYVAYYQVRLETAVATTRAAVYVGVSSFACVTLWHEWGLMGGGRVMSTSDEELRGLHSEVERRERKEEKLEAEVGRRERELQAKFQHAINEAEALRCTEAAATAEQARLTATNGRLRAERQGLLAERRRLQDCLQQLRGNIRVCA